MSPPVRVVAARSRRVAANGRRQGAHVAEMQRRRLLQAFMEVLAERGLEEASIGRVCKRAGVSRRTFYEHFDGREECFLAAFEQAVQRIAPDVATAYAAGGSWRERVRAGLYVLLERFDGEPELARMCVVETLKGGPVVAERRAQVLAVLVGAVEDGRGRARRGGEPPPLTGQGVVGGVLAVIHERLLDRSIAGVAGKNGSTPAKGGASHSLSELAGALMAMIVHPYLGAAAARRELDLPAPLSAAGTVSQARDPFRGLSIRFTYRTARVLATIASGPGASNRQIAENAGVADEGQMSRLLMRLERSGLIENRGAGHDKGAPNAWMLTQRGEAIHTTLAGR